MTTTTTRPQGIQLRRKAGWKLPANAISVARPHKWGNPFAVGQTYKPGDLVRIGGTEVEVAVFGEKVIAETALVAVYLYEATIRRNPGLKAAIRQELAGKSLACFCPEAAVCHRDVLLRIANQQL
jgi:hypothetical protein